MREPSNQHLQSVQRSLYDNGVSHRITHSTEGKNIARVIHPGEVIRSVIYGYSDDGFVIIIATDDRIVFFTRKPIFSTATEYKYDIITGTSSDNIMVFATLVLHTRIHDYKVHWVKKTSAQHFIRFIEEKTAAAGDSRSRNWSFAAVS